MKIRKALQIARTEDWLALPESDQERWIAYQMRYDRELKSLLHSLKRAEYPDAGALVMTLLNTL